MFPGFTELLGSAVPFVGGELSNVASARQASDQRDWSRSMSANAHQRQVADLKAAGLNPLLSGTGGMGAATGSGASATQSDSITPAINTALTATRMEGELELIDQQTSTALTQAGLNTAMHRKVMSEKEFVDTENKILKNTLTSSEIDEKVNKTPGEQTRRLVQKYLDMFRGTGSSAKQVDRMRQRNRSSQSPSQ